MWDISTKLKGITAYETTDYVIRGEKIVGLDKASKEI
jgi:hypothetical protein